MRREHTMQGKVWLYTAETASWHFVSVSKDVSEKIKSMQPPKRGFGSVPVKATIGKTAWKTSLFPYKHAGGYILPLKRAVREQEGIEEGDTITFTLRT